VFTCVDKKVTLCDPIWQVTLRSCVMEFSINGLEYLYLFLSVTLCIVAPRAGV